MVGSDSESLCYALPPRRNFFHGRDDVLTGISQHLLQHANDSIQSPSVSIYGWAGVGKTSVALSFAHMCADTRRYDAIFWLSAETDASSKQSITDIARDLGLIKKGVMDHDVSLHLFRNWLRDTDRSWLLVYGNVGDLNILDNFGPQSPGAVIVTTRYREVAEKVPGINRTIELLTFDEPDTLQVLSGFRKQYHKGGLVGSEASELMEGAGADDSVEDLHRFANVVGGLPLGIEHMAAYMEKDRLTLREFLVRYDSLASQVYQRRDTGSEAPYTIDTLWGVALKALKRDEPAAFRLLQVLSVLWPDSISLDLFAAGTRRGARAAEFLNFTDTSPR